MLKLKFYEAIIFNMITENYLLKKSFLILF